MSPKNRSSKRQVKLHVRYHDHVMENSSQRDYQNRSNEIDIGLGTDEVGNRDLFKECEGNEGAKMNKGVFGNGDNDSIKEGEINESDEVFGSMEYSCGDNSLNISDKQIDSENTDGNKKLDTSLCFRPTVIDDDGCEFVVFDEELVSKGSNMWKLTSTYGFIDVQKRDPNIGLKRKEETKIPLWAKIKNVPLKAWIKDGISALASSLGKTLRMDNITAQACQDGMGKAEFARVLVEFDVKKGFKEEIVIQYKSKENIVKGTKNIANGNLRFAPTSSGRSKEDEGFVEVRKEAAKETQNENQSNNVEKGSFRQDNEKEDNRDWTIQDEIPSAIKKSKNKYDVLEEEEFDEGKELKQLKDRMIQKWEEDKMKENKDQREYIEDVMEGENICAKMCSANEVSGMETLFYIDSCLVSSLIYLL
ncbi:ATPase, F1/V1/A1 complex, alpha/beta subunit [Tanacetum coccineum]